MAWIETDYGSLVNLEKLNIICITETEDTGWSVEGYFPNDEDSVILYSGIYDEDDKNSDYGSCETFLEKIKILLNTVEL